MSRSFDSVYYLVNPLMLAKGFVLPQKYRDALDVITQESGLPQSSILDIRGNHDVFDMGQR